MNKFNQIINIILTTFIFYYLVNEVFKINLFNSTENLQNSYTESDTMSDTLSDADDLKEMLTNIEEDSNYIKSDYKGIGNLQKINQIYEGQVNGNDKISTDIIDENINSVVNLENINTNYTTNNSSNSVNGTDMLDTKNFYIN